MSMKSNINIFENIDTQQKAYWLGFLYADGNVSLKQDKIELSLAQQDLEHIEKFKNFIGVNNKICYRQSTKSYRISFRSQKCKNDLINKGCVPKKSLILTFPSNQQIPEKLLRHFIRGYFDGDGWFTNTEKSFQVDFLGTEDFINGILKTLNNNSIQTNNKIFIAHKQNKDGAKRYVFSSKQDVSKFLNFIYSNSTIYLNRKYFHYLDFLANGSKYHKT